MATNTTIPPLGGLMSNGGDTYISNTFTATVGNRIGIPTEIKNGEGRVALIPSDVQTLLKTATSVSVRIQSGAGLKSGFSDDDYIRAGATIEATATDLYDTSDLIVKVKEPQIEDMQLMKPGSTLFGYLHLAPDPQLVTELTTKHITSIALEHLEAFSGTPQLNPMSEIAGKIAVQMGATYLYTSNGGSGILLGGLGGTSRGMVTILGAGCAGRTAAVLAANMGAKVTIFDKNPEALRIAYSLHPNIETSFVSEDALYNILPHTDILIGAILIPGSVAPKIVTREMVKTMRKGSVIVDISADQGGCIETVRPTTHTSPSYVDEDIIHVAIQNLPGAVPKTSSTILSGVMMQYVKNIPGMIINSNAVVNGVTLMDKAVCTMGGVVFRF